MMAAILAALLAALAVLPPRLSAAPAADAAAATAALRRMLVDYAAARSEIITYGLAERVTALLLAKADQVDAAQRRLTRIEAATSAALVAAGALAAAATLLASTATAPLTALAVLAATATVEGAGAIARSSAREAAVEAGIERLRVLLALPLPDAVPALQPAPLAIGLGSASLAPGSRAALTGASGSGKTRVLEALAGLRSPAHPLTLGGTPVASLSAPAIRAQIALVPQEPMLIAGSVADNLRLARAGLDAAAMEEALRTAQLWARIERMPDGLDTVLSEDGGVLSGGERKRLSLARALLAGRPWLLLDEPSEGLDAATETALVAALEQWLAARGTGLLIASHRPAPLALAATQIAVDTLG